jgi:hypothetical protein
MIGFVLCFSLIVGMLFIGNHASNIILTRTSFASINMVNKTSGDPEHRGTNNILELRMNKNTYRPGETVSITVKNNGVETLTFPDAALGLTIENVGTKESFGFIAAQVLTSLKAGESKSVKWDQRGLDGIQVSRGVYKVSVKTIPDQKLSTLSANSQFRINDNSS